MQLGKKSKTTDMFERVRGDMGGEIDDSPLVAPAAPVAAAPAEPRVSSTMDRDAIHVTISEAISASLSREGAVQSLAIVGDLTLRVSDPSMSKIKLALQAVPSHGAQFRTHPKVDRNSFNNSKVIQLSDSPRGFPVNNAVGVLRWRATPKTDDPSTCPITFTVWINKDSSKYNITVEYELTGGDSLRDVSVVIPYQGSEPVVSSFDASYEVSGDMLEWNIGTVDDENPNGSFEFEAETGDENDFFPMNVRFSKTTPYVDVDVSACLCSRPRHHTDHCRSRPSLSLTRMKRLHSPRKSSLTQTTSLLNRWLCKRGSNMRHGGVRASSHVEASFCDLEINGAMNILKNKFSHCIMSVIIAVNVDDGLGVVDGRREVGFLAAAIAHFQLLRYRRKLTTATRHTR